jgi:mannose-6-phosphate isomerase-like protein (cupin superfamily)
MFALSPRRLGWSRDLTGPWMVNLHLTGSGCLERKVGTLDRPEVEFSTTQLAESYDAIAPDGSEIRLLGRVRGGSMAHGALAPGLVSGAVKHQTVEEIWYVLGGRAELWRRLGAHESVVEIGEGVAITIPVGASFQFRTTSEEPFQFIMCTMPPWPGDDEAVQIEGPWPAVQF